jgi:hypothetical protein
MYMKTSNSYRYKMYMHIVLYVCGIFRTRKILCTRKLFNDDQFNFCNCSSFLRASNIRNCYKPGIIFYFKVYYMSELKRGIYIGLSNKSNISFKLIIKSTKGTTFENFNNTYFPCNTLCTSQNLNCNIQCVSVNRKMTGCEICLPLNRVE